LARAIIRKPDLLILDEATSALDTESERLIQQSIDSLTGEMTIVVIAHRLSTIRNADYIYVLHEGEIAEEGFYQKLSNKSESKLSKMIIEQAL